LPKVSTSGQSGRKRKAQKSELLTSSPFKKVLEEHAERTKMKADRQSIKSARKHAANKKARKTDKKSTKTDKSGQEEDRRRRSQRNVITATPIMLKLILKLVVWCVVKTLVKSGFSVPNVTDGHTLSVQM